jgi:hypothetical protein
MLIHSLGALVANRVRRPSAGVVIATIALALSVTGNAAAAIIISSNSQVAANTISGHTPPAGKHANILAGSVNATDLAPNLRTSLKVHCPSTMHQAVDLCFETATRAATDWHTALQRCQVAGRRLPSTAELAEVFDNTGAPQVDQWSDGLYVNGSTFEATFAEEDSSRQTHVGGTSVSENLAYRCVVGLRN